MNLLRTVIAISAILGSLSVSARLVVYDTKADFQRLHHELPVIEKYYETEAEVLGLANGGALGPNKGIFVYTAHSPHGGFYHVRLRPLSSEPIWNTTTDNVQILIRYASHTNFAVWDAGSPVSYPPLPATGPNLINWRTEVFPNARNWYFNLEAIIGPEGFLVLDQIVIGINEPPFPIDHTGIQPV